jgi:hypothetical protein
MDLVLLLHLSRPLFTERKEWHLRKIHWSSTYTILAILYVNALARFDQSLAFIISVKMCLQLFALPLFVAAQLSLFNRKRRQAKMFIERQRGFLARAKKEQTLETSVERLWKIVNDLES